MEIGRFSVEPVIDGWIVAETNYAYPTIEPESWAPHADLLTAGGKMFNQVGGFLIRDGSETILLDNGAGIDPPEPFQSGHLLEALAAIGITPAEVTIMLFTHLHFDHIGWTTQDGELTFPNARHIANRTDWDYFFSGKYPGTRVERPHDFPHRRLAPLTDRIELWDKDGELLPGLKLRLAAGHTPGHAMIELESNGERGLLVGDVAHHQTELLEYDWAGVADIDPAQARATAHEVADELVARDLPFAAAHFPGMSWGRIEEVEGRRRWVSLEPQRTASALAAAAGA